MQTTLSLVAIGERARALYTARIRSLIAEEDFPKFLVVDISSGDFEVDADEDVASDRIEARQPISCL